VTGLVSGEGVAIELSRAGLGSRTIAAAIDIAVQIGLLIVASIVTSLLSAGDPDAQTAITIIEIVLILAGYPILFEWLGHGVTLGKLAMGLRVVRDDGGPIGFRQALVRGLAGFLLEKPGIVLVGLGTLIGMTTIQASGSCKRIGDMMAGTFVLNERAGPASAVLPLQLWVPPALYGWAASLDLSRIDDHLALQLRQFVLRASELSPLAQAALGEQFLVQVLAAISPAPPAGVPTLVLLSTILAERRRRAEFAATRPQSVPMAPSLPPPPSWTPTTGPPPFGGDGFAPPN